jgi:hypothetical protein
VRKTLLPTGFDPLTVQSVASRCIDCALPACYNNNNNNNNKDLTIEIKRMWNVKTRVIPVIIGATGTISKLFRKYVSTILGNHENCQIYILLGQEVQ